MKTKRLSLVALMLTFIAFSQGDPHQSAQLELSEDTQNSQHLNYVRISINNSSDFTLNKLNDIGVDLTCGVTFDENQITLEVREDDLQDISDQGISYTVLINDMQKFYSERAVADLPKAKLELQQAKLSSAEKSYSVNEIINNVGQYDGCDEIDWAVPANWNLNPNSSPNSFGGCLTYAQVLQELDDMRAQYPNLISARLDASPTNQTTIEGRTVWYVRISDNPDIDEAGEPETLYQSLIHSREAASVMQNLFFMWYLLENYATDSAIRNLVNNQALYFIPVFNPDGFVYNETVAPDGGGGQRKNRNLSAPGSCSTYLEGVDLNRNSAYYWGNGGSSTNSCSDTYLGTAPFSEPETQIMRDFFLLHDFELALNHHSFKNAMLHAYAGTTITNPRPDEYSKYNHDMTYYNRYAHGPSTSISALNSGNMNDWMLGGPAGVSANGTPTGTGSGKETLAWTPENGLSSEGTGGSYGGFWPQPSNYLPISRRAMRANFMAAYFSGKYARLHDLNQSDLSSLNGNLSFGIENLGQTASDFTLTVTPVSSNITSIGGPSVQSGMTVLQQNNVNISYALDPGIQANDEIEFKVVLTNDYASDNVLFEANIIKRYQPNTIFADNPDTDNLTNWTQSGTWSTTSDAYSGSTAITSTSGASYGNNESKQLQLNTSLDLTGIPTVLIQFYGKWDLERSFDYVQIEGSTNGSTWTPLCGRLTKPGAPNANNTYSGKSSSDNNFQPDGQDLYDGDTQDKWSMEEIVIDPTNNSFLYNQSTVFLRFDFRTDSSNREDSYVNVDFEGFSFDDFKVIGFEAPCVEAVPTGLAVSGITANSATATWDVIPAVTYDLRYREVGAPSWTDVNDLSSNSYDMTGLNPLTDYEVQVRSKCSVSAVSNYTTSTNFTTLDVQLNYCSSASTNVNDEYISRVQLNTIDNSSGAQFYSDFTAISTTLTKGDQYTITITPTWTGTIYNEAYSVWIDYNKDGDFSDAGEQVYTQGPTTATPVSGNFTIPSGAVETSTRMRVSMKYNGIPTECETFTWGEVEDYTVIIESATPDTTPPVITLNGSSPVDLNVGDTYTELGATATDDVDGDISANVVIGGDVVNTNIAGTYVVTYNVSDAAGNAATEVTRTVNVIPDTTPPVITLIGASVINLTIGDTYNEQGATATDNIDGDISANVVIGGDIVNTNLVGTYVVTYNVDDAAGNSATQVTRTVNVNPDVTPPVITLIGSATVNLNIGGVYTELGATATDNVDGDISANIVIGGDVVNTSVAATYLVTYNVSDAAGNAATEVVRTVIVAPDVTPPIITLNGASTINLDIFDTYTELGATATDNVDGDLTGAIVIGGDVVNTSVPNTYIVTYDVSDSSGNAATQVTRTVIVNPDTEAPVITLNGAATINLNVGDTYTEQGATATDNIDGDLTSSIVIGGDVVNTSIAGTYIVTYNVSDSSGNAATQVSRTVNVIPDTTPPVITLIGNAVIDLIVGDTYTEQGATATDNIDGDISANIVIGGDVVNTNVAGTYVVTYNVSDAAGNAATQVTRTVNVTEPSTGCSGGITSYPYTESFEGSIGTWSQVAGDDLDWTVDSGGTPSNNTGPSSGSSGSFYIYVEASGNNTGYPNKQAIINSPCFDLSGMTNPVFKFDYHMFGSTDMGTIDLEISDDDGGTWNSIWNESGNKGNQWLSQSIDLSAYVGGSVQLRFNRVTGGTWQADIAIDNINLEQPAPPTCDDGIQNGDEEGVDCGGSFCAPCTTTEVVLNQGFFETGWDGWIDGGSDSFRYSGANSYEGIYSIRLRDNTSSSVMTLPNVDVTPYDQIEVEFFFFPNSMENGEDFWLQYYNGSSYVTVETYVSGTDFFNGSFYTDTVIIDAAQYNFVANAGFRFRCDASGNNDQIYIDQVTIKGISQGSQTAQVDPGESVFESSAVKPSLQKVRLYPNPVMSQLKVSTNGQSFNYYEVYNKFNQIVLKGNFNDAIDVSRLKSGVYYIRLYGSNGTVVNQFIKK